MMTLVLHFSILLLITISCSAGPLDDLANMPDLSLVSSSENKTYHHLHFSSSSINN